MPRICALILLLAAGAEANPFRYSWEEPAPGVWAAIREDPFELPQEGNAVFVLTDEGVVLFDAGGSPAMGEAIVAKVRSLTKQPITHVVLSHWHGDHMRGLQAIRAAFPKAQILSHPHSRERIDATREKWLKRRVTMVPNIAKVIRAALAEGHDLSGRPLIPKEKTWLEAGLSIIDELDKENRRTDYVLPAATFEDRLTLHLGGKELQFLHLGNAHTGGDVVLWLPREKIVAAGDIVTAPVPLMPSPYTGDYVSVLSRIKSLGFTALIPGHGAIQRDAQYIDLLADTVRAVSTQMKAFVAQGLSQADAVAKVDFAAIEPRFTHGDPFLANRFHDYLDSLPAAAFAAERGKAPEEAF